MENPVRPIHTDLNSSLNHKLGEFAIPTRARKFCTQDSHKAKILSTAHWTDLNGNHVADHSYMIHLAHISSTIPIPQVPEAHL